MCEIWRFSTSSLLLGAAGGQQANATARTVYLEARIARKAL